MPPDAKPPARYIASFEEWERITAEKIEGHSCRGCGRNHGITRHHLVSRSLRGDDVAANIVPLCGSGTTGCHGAIETHSPGWEAIAHAVRDSLSPLEEQYILAKKGQYWLDRYYPASSVLCESCRKPLKAKKERTGEELPPRKKKDWTLSVPDDVEDGAEVLETLTIALAERLGFDDETSRLRRYHAVIVALVFATQNIEELAMERGTDE